MQELVVEPPVGAGAGATARWQADSSCWGPSTTGGAGNSRRCAGEGSDWGAWQGALRVGKFTAEELQEVGCWLDLMNSGVVETTSKLAYVLPLPRVSSESAPGILYVRRFRRCRSAFVGIRLAVVVNQLLLQAIV